MSDRPLSASSEWHRGLTAFVLTEGRYASDHDAAVEVIRSLGGGVALASQRVLLGWLDSRHDVALLGKHGIRAIARTPERFRLLNHPKITGERQRQEAQLLAFFNEVASGRLARGTEEGLKQSGPPLHGDAFENPLHAHRARSDVREDSHTAWNFEQMRGTVRVVAFQIESDGSVDANQYNWAGHTEWGTITNQIFAGFAFWSNQAWIRGIPLTFYVSVWEPYALNCQVAHEPFAHASNEDHLWVNEVLRKMDTNAPHYVDSHQARPGGFGASPMSRDNVFIMATQYNEYLRLNDWGPYDWAVTLFVATDGGGARHFTNGVRGAYAYRGGPWIQMSYTNTGWGPHNFNVVMNHEIGHIFWACDEYWDPVDGGCSLCTTCGAGPRPSVSNANCANPTASGCQPHQPCIMDRADSNAMCNITPQQVGWQ